MSDGDEMAALLEKGSRMAEEVAGSYGVTLDRSEGSVGDVERVLGMIHDEYRSTGEERGLYSLSFGFAAYLVAVLDRHHGPIDWQRDHASLGENSFPLYWRGSTLFPVSWCWKRIIDGPADDVAFKWRVAVLGEGQRPSRGV